MKIESKEKINAQNNSEEGVPAEQNLQEIIKRAIEGINWLNELKEECDNRRKRLKDSSVFQLRMHIVEDIISVYITTLFEKSGSDHSHSLLKFYNSQFFENFAKLQIVKKLEMHRHNRCGHASKSYGFCVSSEEIFKSNLKDWLKEAQYFLCMYRKN